jgi:hypothetical protein
MEAVSSSVSVGEDELAPCRLVHTVGPVKNFEEEAWYWDGMGRRTCAIVDATEICNMFRIGEIEILTIPARLEIDLCPHTIDTALCIAHVMWIWIDIVSSIYAAETYPVSDWPRAIPG